MKTTKKFIQEVKADLANSNVHYSNLWSVVEKNNYLGNSRERRISKTYAALVYVFESKESETPIFRVYYNYDASMGDEVSYTPHKTIEGANKELAYTII